jgi:predicted 3-demethylubiquinone-9 3-methyltransferase (glyoxalase superfamily)
MTTQLKPSSRKAARPVPAGVQPIAPCLWFDDQSEQAAQFYVSVFSQAKINHVARYPAVGQEIHGRAPGSVMVVEFVLNGLTFTALNGGPIFKFNEAVSLQVYCEDQKEIDYYWERLTEGGDPKAQQCGWLKDRYGLSWQVVPTGMDKMLKDHTSPKSQRAMEAVMQMKKFDLGKLKRAYAGK